MKKLQKLLFIINDAAKSYCGCSEARGVAKLPLIEGVELSNMMDFSQWIVDCDKISKRYI